MVKKTLAAVLVELARPLEIMELGIPELRPGQVLVEIVYSGMCQSQLNEMLGRRGPDRFLPHTLGHEGSGTVLAVGEGVNKVRPGDAVVISWLRGTGADVAGSAYVGPHGAVNSGAVSTFIRDAVISENRLTPMPPGVPLREAALLGCAVPTGAGIVLNTLKPEAGQSLAVFGMGGIGLSAVMAAGSRGVDPLIAVDVLDGKLSVARSLGATNALNAREHDVVEAIRSLTHGKGVDFAIEAAGRPEAMQWAYRSVRTAGGLCVIAGNAPVGSTLQIDPFDLVAGRRIVGTWGGESDPDVDFPRYGQMYAAGRLPLWKLISGEYDLAQINVALADLAGGKIARALVRL